MIFRHDIFYCYIYRAAYGTGRYPFVELFIRRRAYVNSFIHKYMFFDLSAISYI